MSKALDMSMLKNSLPASWDPEVFSLPPSALGRSNSLESFVQMIKTLHIACAVLSFSTNLNCRTLTMLEIPLVAA